MKRLGLSIADAPAPDPERVEAIYQRDVDHLHRTVDRMFFWLLLLEWALAVLLAAVLSPYTWAGRVRTLHIHVELAVLLGGVINALPIWLILRRPGSFATRCAISVSQALWSSLLIHLTGGRIETHFHIFGSLAVLAFYRDWRALVPVTVLVATDHLLRGLYLPESIFGVLDVERWRFLEHTAWVLFEDTFLVIGCLRATRDSRRHASREAQMETAFTLLAESAAQVEQKVAERTVELAEAQAQQKAVLEACNAVPWEFDLAGGSFFTYIAPQVERMCGWPAERFREPGFLLSNIHADDRKAVKLAFTTAAPGAHGAVEYRLRRKDGTYATVRAEYQLEIDRAGRRLFRGLSLDLTKERALELELRQAQKLESVGRLSAGVAHEINTPVQFVSDSIHFVRDAARDLFPLLAHYQQLEQAVAAGTATPALAASLVEERAAADLDYLAEHVPRAIERSLDGIGRVADIVRSLREFAHPDSKEMACVDLNRALENTLTICRSEYKLVADVETKFAELPPVSCFAGEINQVLLNIVVNAAQAIGEVVGDTGRKGTIRIETVQEGEQVAIAIGDTGCGIPLEIRDRIFDPFFTTKEVGKGTGQGLAIARSVVQDKHGGSLAFTSEPGVGTTFTIRLPIDGKRAKERQGAASPLALVEQVA